MQADILSVNVGQPRDVIDGARRVTTSIWKAPADLPIRVASLNLQGDAQSDLKAHGGPNKAIYAYPHEHYSYWLERLKRTSPPEFGYFGENLTLLGLFEQDVFIGDRYRLGSAQVTVTQPRIPCFKLGIRVGDPSFPADFLASGRLGFYMRVEVEGALDRNDKLVLLERVQHLISVHGLWQMTREDSVGDPRQLARALELPHLAVEWTRALKKRQKALA